MTDLLSQAFEKASQLPENLQDELAKTLLDELAWELRWDKTLDQPSPAFDALASEALAEHKKGNTKQMGFDQL